MKLIACIVLSVATVGYAQDRTVAWDVPAVSYTTPPSHPCNMPSGGGNGWTYAVCITGDETHWACSDDKRVLLTSEDGVRHCILFPPQQPEVVVATKQRKI